MKQEEEVRLTHSGIIGKNGRRYVSVRFERGNDVAEGSLPECKITKNSGFSADEVERLEDYLTRQCDVIFAKAKEIGGLKNLFTDGGK